MRFSWATISGQQHQLSLKSTKSITFSKDLPPKSPHCIQHWMNPTENASVNIFVQLSIYTCAVHVHVHVRYLFFAGFVFFHLAVLNFTGELARSCIKLSAEEGNRVGRCSCQLLFKFFILFSEFLFQFFFCGRWGWGTCFKYWLNKSCVCNWKRVLFFHF